MACVPDIPHKTLGRAWDGTLDRGERKCGSHDLGTKPMAPWWARRRHNSFFLSLCIRSVPRGLTEGDARQAGALRWQGQIAMATRGRDLHLNVPLPRKPPDLLMAESPPTGGLSAFNGARERERVAEKAAGQGRMSFSVAVNRSPDSSSSPSMCRRAGPVSVHRSRK
jgi:hypothetical protein